TDVFLEPDVFNAFANGFIYDADRSGPVDEDMHDVHGKRDFIQSPKRPVAIDWFSPEIYRDDMHTKFGFQKRGNGFGDTVGAVGESHNGPSGTGSTKQRD